MITSRFRRVLAPFARAWIWTAWRLAPSRNHFGIRVAAFLSDNAHQSLEDVGAALRLIHDHDPESFARIHRYFRGVLVHGTETYRDAHWLNRFRLCVLTERFIASPETTTGLIASTMVHESMHAHLIAIGVPYIQGRRARSEVLCAMATLSFARRIPNGTDLEERARSEIDAWTTAGEERWSDRSYHTAVQQHLTELEAPRWLLRLLRRLLGWRAA